MSPLEKLRKAAQAGRHVYLSGPAGMGKTMLASRYAALMSPPSEQELEEASFCHTLARCITERDTVRTMRPLRAPHHTASMAGLMGAAWRSCSDAPFRFRPGEVSLAHKGALLLDELPEFRLDVIRVLGQAVKKGSTTLHTDTQWVTWSADVRIVATGNTCPCGRWGDGTTACQCTDGMKARYHDRIAKMLKALRVDLEFINVPRLTEEEIDEIQQIPIGG